jgi:hypothetical protein
MKRTRKAVGVRQQARVVSGPRAPLSTAAMIENLGVVLDARAFPWNRQEPLARVERHAAASMTGWAEVCQALRTMPDEPKDEAIRFALQQRTAPHVVAALACSRITLKGTPC